MAAGRELSERMGARDQTVPPIVNDDATTRARDNLMLVHRVSGVQISKGREPTKSDRPRRLDRWLMDMKHVLGEEIEPGYKRADKAKRATKPRGRSDDALVLQHKPPRALDSPFDDDESAYDADVDEAKYVQIVYEEASI